MTHATITVEILRPIFWKGDHLPAGAKVGASALEAQQLIDSTRARLVHAADAKACKDAVHADVRAALKAAGSAAPQPPEGWPWRPI
jgi:hypothetical protein